MTYQQLGLTDDPELSQILKFIDKFGGKDFVSVRDLTQWWSPKSTRNSVTIREFMVRIVCLGYAIENGEPQDSSKYRIKVAAKSANNANKTAPIHTGLAVGMLDTMPTQHAPEATKPIESESWIDVGITANSPKASDSDEIALDRGQDVGICANRLEPFTTVTSGDSVGNVDTFSGKPLNLKIGDRVSQGDNIFIVKTVEDGIACGWSIDGSDYYGVPISTIDLVLSRYQDMRPKPRCRARVNGGVGERMATNHHHRSRRAGYLTSDDRISQAS